MKCFLPYISVSVSANCSGTYDDYAMIITSPDDSFINPICSWTITVPTDKTVNLRFINLNLETSVDCEVSYLQIFDGPNSNSTTFGSKLCGTNIPDNIESTGNSLFLLFNKTANSENENKFQIKLNEKGNHIYDWLAY